MTDKQKRPAFHIQIDPEPFRLTPIILDANGVSRSGFIAGLINLIIEETSGATNPKAEFTLTSEQIYAAARDVDAERRSRPKVAEVNRARFIK